MEYRYLGRTGIRVSPLCVGTMTFGDKTDQDEADRIVQKAIDAGFNFFDTANVYTDSRSEQVLGKAVARTGMRQHLVIATKCHGNMHKDVAMNPNQWGNSRRQIIEQCEASLQRLNMDYIDLYQIHRPHSACAIDETLRALDDLVRSGKVRYIGCSTFAAWQVVEALWCSDRLGLNRFVTEQPPYNLLDRRIERELIPMARTFGFGLIPWSPLAAGFLSDKYQRGKAPTEGRMSRPVYIRKGALELDAAWKLLDVLREIAQEKSCTVAQLSIAWCMNQPGITSAIIGPRTLEQFEDNALSLGVTLTAEDHQRIDAVSPPGSCIDATYYEADFGPGAHRW